MSDADQRNQALWLWRYLPDDVAVHCHAGRRHPLHQDAHDR